jgi:DNA-binding SARP family transcriptional activator
MTQTSQNPGFSFRLLGDFRLQSSLATCDLHISRRTQEVFAFLVFNANKPVRRATLSNLIWIDQEERRSRANLNTALWRINRALKSVATDAIELNVHGSQLNLAVASDVFIDVFALEAAVREASTAGENSAKAPLSALIRTTLIDILSDNCECLLEGLSSEWVLIERERFFNLQIRGLTLLMQDLAESGRIEEALDYGRRILRMDPMRECVQRQVMWLHVLNGHQGNAIRQYLECVRILKTELGVPPMAETRALYDFIVAANFVSTDVAPQPHRADRLAPAPSADRSVGDRSAGDLGPGAYDAELTRLRSLMAQLNNQRQSVFAALAESGTG